MVSPASSGRMMLKTATAPGMCLASDMGFSRPSGWYPAESTRAMPVLDLESTASIFMFLWPVRMPLKKYFPFTGAVNWPGGRTQKSKELKLKNKQTKTTVTLYKILKKHVLGFIRRCILMQRQFLFRKICYDLVKVKEWSGAKDNSKAHHFNTSLANIHKNVFSPTFSQPFFNTVNHIHKHQSPSHSQTETSWSPRASMKWLE